MKKIDLSNVEDLTEYRAPFGGVVAYIKKVEDVPESQYLKITYDILEPEEFKGYYTEQEKKRGWSRGSFIKSYKEGKARSFFKGFITAVEESNPNFVWDGEHEKQLEKKIVGLVIGKEEYIGNNGNLYTREYIDQIHSVEKIRNGDFTTPQLKRLDPSKEVQNKPAFNDPFADNSSSQKETDPFAASDDNPFA